MNDVRECSESVYCDPFALHSQVQPTKCSMYWNTPNSYLQQKHS